MFELFPVILLNTKFTLQHARLIFLLSSPPDNIESRSSSNGLLLIKEIRYKTAYEISDSISCLFTVPYINAKLQAHGVHDIFPETMWIPSQVKIINSFLSNTILCYICKNTVIHTANILADLVDHYIITKYEMITTYYFPSWRWQILSLSFRKLSPFPQINKRLVFLDSDEWSCSHTAMILFSNKEAHRWAYEKHGWMRG